MEAPFRYASVGINYNFKSLFEVSVIPAANGPDMREQQRAFIERAIQSALSAAQDNAYREELQRKADERREAAGRE